MTEPPHTVRMERSPRVPLMRRMKDPTRFAHSRRSSKPVKFRETTVDCSEHGVGQDVDVRVLHACMGALQQSAWVPGAWLLPLHIVMLKQHRN